MVDEENPQGGAKVLLRSIVSVVELANEPADYLYPDPAGAEADGLGATEVAAALA